MKSLLIASVSIVGTIFFCSCTKSNTSRSTSGHQSVDFICHAGDLTFDKVEAYTISDEELRTIENRKTQSENDKLVDQIVNYYPIENLKGIDSVKFIELGFTQKSINKEDYKYLCDLFQEPYVYEDTMACLTEFRDILLFKENYKITGIAKICYSCGHSVVRFGESIRNVNVYRLDALLN